MRFHQVLPQTQLLPYSLGGGTTVAPTEQIVRIVAKFVEVRERARAPGRCGRFLARSTARCAAAARRKTRSEISGSALQDAGIVSIFDTSVAANTRVARSLLLIRIGASSRGSVNSLVTSAPTPEGELFP